MAASETQFMNDPAPGSAPRAVAPSASSQGNTISAQTIGQMNDRTTMKNIAQQTGGERSSTLTTSSASSTAASKTDQPTTRWPTLHRRQIRAAITGFSVQVSKQELEAGLSPRLLQHSSGDGRRGRNGRVAHRATAGHAARHIDAADGFA